MKAKIGMRVSGECAIGNIVAMSRQWCIYQDDNGEEIAEPWDVIVAEIETPETATSSTEEGPEIPTS